MHREVGFYHVFPFRDVKKGEDVIIWGMGEVGRQYVEQILKTDYCHINFCVDKGYETMSKYRGIDILSPEKLRNRGERVVIANGSRDVAEGIRRELSRFGFDGDRVIYHDLICENIVSVRDGKRKKQSGKNFFARHSGEKEDVIEVGFYIHGGLGDMLININYILAFRNKFKESNIKINLHLEEKKNYVSDFLPKNLSGIDHISYDKHEKEISERESDLFIDILRYPWVKRANLDKIKILYLDLAKYALLLKQFEIQHSRYYYRGAKFDGIGNMECEVKKVHRFHQTDVYKYLSMGDKIFFDFSHIDAVYKRMDLPRKYITVNRDVDSGGMFNKPVSTLKLWPTAYYNKLIKLIKKNYPGIPVIAVGANCDPGLMGYDINMVGKTSAWEIEAILKYSALHISSEGGTVHLRHMLGGGMSVVLFGPTSPRFYGYSENINLRSSACEHPCEWVTKKWVQKCINISRQHICMLDLTPEYVIGEIKKKWIWR